MGLTYCFCLGCLACWCCKNVRPKRELLLGIAALSVAGNLWGISPLMMELKVMGLATSPQLYGMTFAQWRGVSQVLFMLTLVLLVVWGIRFGRSR